jgi:D-sedoheptulose 7-phosphate isomerase
VSALRRKNIGLRQCLSTSVAQHVAAEIVGRFEKEHRAYPTTALTTGTSVITALGNDYVYDRIFARQLDGLG